MVSHRDARRIWFWRYSGLFLTIFFCMFCGGILTEIIQAALPVSSLYPCISHPDELLV